MRTFILGAAFSVLLASGCGGGDGESCFPTVCSNEKSAQACCTETQCRYVVSDGTVFDCDGANCEEAATELAIYCQS